RARARSRSALPRTARRPGGGPPRSAPGRRPPPPQARRPRAAPRRRRAAPRACARACRADRSGSGGAGCPFLGPFVWNCVLLRTALDPDRGERCRLLDGQLPRAAKLEQREERRRLLEPRELLHLGLEVEARTAAKNG